MPRSDTSCTKRAQQLKLLAVAATRKRWINLMALHFAAAAYKFPVFTRQTLKTLATYGMVDGDFTEGKEVFWVTAYGRKTLKAPEDTQREFFRKLRDFSSAPGVCAHCGGLGPVFVMKKESLCANCLNPDYEVAYTPPRASSLVAE
jgi:hypothetical protein